MTVAVMDKKKWRMFMDGDRALLYRCRDEKLENHRSMSVKSQALCKKTSRMTGFLVKAL